MKKYKFRHRFTALLLAFLMCMSLMPATVLAEEIPASSEVSSVSESASEPQPDSSSVPESEAASEASSAATSESASTSTEEPAPDSPTLSEQAQAFIAAVDALDRESILSAVNSWALASQAWQADKENPDLIAALDEATVLSDEASAPVTAAEDLYLSLTEEEKANEAVAAAYSALAALVVTMQATIETPSVPSEGGDDAGSPPDLEEIHQMLYGDLPDAPTDSYMGSYGLPVATGDTKIGISHWNDDPSVAIGYMDSEALNSDGLSITVPRQAGESFAIVPIFVQVEYPANNSTSQIVLPEDVVLLDYSGNPADEQTTAAILNSSYVESSAATTGIYVQADHDFAATFRYNAPDGTSLEKALNVHLEGETKTQQAKANRISTYEARPEPAVKTGKITSVQKVNGSWLIWFNGEEAYCCTHGAQGKPAGCPTYNYSHTSIVTAAQYTPGDHYSNQVNIWGGLGQLSLGLMSADATIDSVYDEVQRWIITNYPDSVPAKSYIRSFEQMSNGASTYVAESDYYTYIYQPPISGWQTIALIGPPTGSIDPDVPPAGAEYYASWSASPQTVSGSFDANYTVNVDKQQLETGEKVDGATIEIEPLEKGGTIDGGTWAITPADKQTVTTSGHTMDDSYQEHGGDASASWSLHYSVTKTSTSSLSGSEGPYASQAEADAAAASAKASAEAQLRAEAQNMVNQAIAAAKSQLATIDFRFDEITVPVGFEFYDGEFGSKQTISVPMDRAQDYLMRNDEWSLQVNIRKTDSETSETIASDAEYEVFEWDVVSQMYIPFCPPTPRAAVQSSYNDYYVVRNADGTYSVANGSDYGTEFDTSRTMYYTQRNLGRFIVVETKAPDGYFGDWTDIEQPGEAGTPLGKRGYYIEITEDNDGSVIWLENAHYSADIATSYIGGTKLLTSDGVETTVTIYKAGDEPAAEIQYQDAGRVYDTDNSKTAANENSYTMTPTAGVMQNDRVLGEISLSKVDLDAVRYVNGRDTDGNAMASGQAHADARLDGAVYDLYAAEDIQHPDGVTGTVDYSKITYADGTPIWHTTIRDNSGQWVDDYLPVLAKDHLVASAVIEDGWLTFSNLYLGSYYIVERGTGAVIPVEDGAYKISGTYPDVDAKTKAPTGTTSALATNEAGQYTDYVYKHQWSGIGQGYALDGTRTYDGYYESYALGYLCDEHNYYIAPSYSDEGWYVEKTAFEDNRQAEGEQLDTTEYSAYYHLHRNNALAESQDQVMKGNLELTKRVSSTGSSDGVKLEGAGFTLYLISDLSKEEQFAQSRSGKYLIQSILDAYINPQYDQDHPKYDFSGETQAIAKTYEVDADQIADYNATLKAIGDFKNGSGDGWVATGRPNEYVLSEIFSNEIGTIRVEGLPYGQYLVVESTTPADVFQAQPFIVTIDPADETVPQSGMANPKDSEQKPSGSYQEYTILDEEIEVYLRVTKLDEETGKPVLLKGAAFQIYWMDEQGNHILDDQGHAKLVTMTDTTNPLVPKNVDTFYTDDTGTLVLPEKLPLGHYRLVEINGPNGFYNEWAATAVYEDGHLQIDDTGRFADGSFYVDFAVTTDRAYKATGDDSEDSQDILVIDENYANNETLGMLKIRKTGEVLIGWQEENGEILDPEFSGMARPGHFVYEERPVAGAEFTITAAEDIYTQDWQTNANGERTLWYAKGDVVAVVTTGDGTSDINVFRPGRTQATYDFLSVIHDGTVGEVIVTLPLGTYHVQETKAPYGFADTTQSYDVTFEWDSQLNDVVMAYTITEYPSDGSESRTSTFSIVNASAAGSAEAEAHVLCFHNERVKPEIDVYKKDIKTGELVAGAVYNLITTDPIYTADGKLLFHAGDLIATSAPTDENGHTTFVCDLPMRGQYYGVDDVYIPENIYGTGADHTKNSGNYSIREIKAPDGYYLDAPDAEITFTYAGAESATVTIESTFQNDATSFHVSKRELTGDEELPGAKLTIKDTDGNVVREWISGEEPVEIRGLLFDKVYTLTETNPAPGYALAEDIRFKLVQSKNEDGDLINAADVYVCTGKDWLIFDHWEKMEDGMVVMRDDIIRVEISKQDITTKQELPGAHLVIKDENGNVIASWVSSDKPYYIEKLPAGKYVLIEESAPDGYLVAEKIEFEVKPTGEIQTVIMYDSRVPTPEQPTPEPPIPPALPQTGDLPWLPVALGIAAAGAAIGILVMSRKRDLALRDDDSKREQQDHEQ